jgi:hypothetical protein
MVAPLELGVNGGRSGWKKREAVMEMNWWGDDFGGRQEQGECIF